MNHEALQTAIAEAKRFLERAEKAERGFEWRENARLSSGGYWRNDDTTATAAAKRASMDLTRALADLRRPS